MPDLTQVTTVLIKHIQDKNIQTWNAHDAKQRVIDLLNSDEDGD